MLSWGEYLAHGVFEEVFTDNHEEREKKFHPIMFPSGINADFKNYKNSPPEDFLKSFKEKFEDPEARDIASCAPAVIQLFSTVSNLSTGSTVLDFGSGTGLLVPLLSKCVGSTGLILSTEVSDLFLSNLSVLVEQQNLSNVSVRKTSEKDLFLNEFTGLIDLAIICDVYHHLEFPRTIIRNIRRLLKPNTGRLIVLDFIRDDKVHTSHPPGWIYQHVRASQAVFRREILSCGFTLTAEPSMPELAENYIMVFKPVPLSTVGAGWGCRQFRAIKPSGLPAPLPEGFVYLDQVDRTIQSSLRYASKENFIGSKIDGYNGSRVIITDKAASALVFVQQDLLADGFSLVVYDAYRPQKAVDHFVRWSADPHDQIKRAEYYPDIRKQDVFELGYIAKRSSHSRGSAVDVTIIKADRLVQHRPAVSYRSFAASEDETQRAQLPYLDDGTVDMGTSFDFLGIESHHMSLIIPEHIDENRIYLKSLMEKHGFEPYSHEWWHYSLAGEPFPDTFFDFDII